MPDCPRHSGILGRVAAAAARAPLDREMRDLDNSQSGEGRHKCAYCAYEAGLRAGREEARNEILQFIQGLRP